MIDFDPDENDMCAYCKHMRKYHYQIYDSKRNRNVTVCSPKMLGFKMFCGCQKFQEPKEKRNGAE